MMVAVLFALLALAGAPLFAVIAASAMWGFAGEDVDLQVMGIEIYRLAETPVLLAIPLFTFAGYLLGESGAGKSSLVNMVLGRRAIATRTRAPLGTQPSRSQAHNLPHPAAGAPSLARRARRARRSSTTTMRSTRRARRAPSTWWTCPASALRARPAR